MNHFMLSDSAYDRLKKIVQIVLPAVSSLYFGLAQIWGWPGAEKVVGTLAIVTTFLGVVIGISAREYIRSGAAGEIHIIENPNGPDGVAVDLGEAPGVVADKDAVLLKVCPVCNLPESEKHTH